MKLPRLALHLLYGWAWPWVYTLSHLSSEAYRPALSGQGAWRSLKEEVWEQGLLCQTSLTLIVYLKMSSNSQSSPGGEDTGLSPHPPKDVLLGLLDIPMPTWASSKSVCEALVDLCFCAYTEIASNEMADSECLQLSLEEASHLPTSRPIMQKLQLFLWEFCWNMKRGLYLAQAGLKLAVLLPQPP